MATQTYTLQMITEDGDAISANFKSDRVLTPRDILMEEIKAVKAWLAGAPLVVDTRVVLADLGVVWRDWILSDSEAKWEALA
jgi:hypothetical protein